MRLRCWLLWGAIALCACGGKSTVPSSSDGTGGSGGTTLRSCDELSSDYAQQLEKARICGPELAVEQCTEQVSSGLDCGCPTFVNPANAEALSALGAAVQDWQAQGCGDETLCGPCLTDPAFAVCGVTPPNSSVPGQCEESR